MAASSIPLSPARVIHSKLTKDQYNEPATFSTGINFPTNSEGHPYSLISHVEMPPDTPISLQQCSCKLAEQTDLLEQWTIRGNSTCMQCKDPLNRSDIITRTRRISQFIMNGLVVSATLLPIILSINFNDCVYSQYLSGAMLSITAISVLKKTTNIFLDKAILPKIARVFIKYIPSGIAAIYVGSFLTKALCGSEATHIPGFIASTVATALVHLGTKYTTRNVMNRFSDFLSSD